MSEVEIGSGGRIAVSVPLLREQAGVLNTVRARLENVAESLAAAGRELSVIGETGAFAACDSARTLVDRGEALCSGLGQAADTYEYAEWMATAEAHQVADVAKARALEQELARADAADPEGFARAQRLFNGQEGDPLSVVGRELLADGTTPFALLAVLLARTNQPGSWGQTRSVSVIPASAGLLSSALRLASAQPAIRAGRVEPGVVSPVDTDADVAATHVGERAIEPHALNLAGMLDTLPAGADLSVTSYEFEAGREHIIAIGGTENWWPVGSDDVLDLDSNLELFFAQESALRAAVAQAVADAGVLPTEPVTVVGYSQGAMGALAEASDQRLNVGEVITLGSPQDHWLPERVRHVDLAHLSDPVAALAVGGWATSGLGRRDVTVRGAGGHGLGTYRETARKADASGDPRIRQLHDDWQRFGDAKTAVRREYELERKVG